MPQDAEARILSARKDCRVTVAQRVLVVDGLSETEAVLRAVLEPKGLEVDRVRGADTGVFSRGRQAAKQRPSLVVLHVEDGRALIPASDGWQDVPRIVIGATKDVPPSRLAAVEHHLEKPFQYGELIRTIERLLAEAGS
jgi:DNA-binding NtrC family response regulator